MNAGFFTFYRSVVLKNSHSEETSEIINDSQNLLENSRIEKSPEIKENLGVKVLLYREFLSKPQFNSDPLSSITVPDKKYIHHQKYARPDWNAKSPYSLNSKQQKGI